MIRQYSNVDGARRPRDYWLVQSPPSLFQVVRVARNNMRPFSHHKAPPFLVVVSDFCSLTVPLPRRLRVSNSAVECGKATITRTIRPHYFLTISDSVFIFFISIPHLTLLRPRYQFTDQTLRPHPTFVALSAFAPSNILFTPLQIALTLLDSRLPYDSAIS